MTAVVETWRRIGVNGTMKKVMIKGSTATGSGHTLDMHSDASDGKGTVMEVITDAYHVGLTGTRVDASWVAATGVVTLGTIAGTPAAVYIFVEGY